MIFLSLCFQRDKNQSKLNSFLNILAHSRAVSVHGIFTSNGIFVWWPKVNHINVTAYLIQFKSDEAIAFSDVIGTTRTIDEFETWDDISGDSMPIQVITNIHQNYEDDDAMSTQSPSNGNKTIGKIVELRVDGNVSGILIPNKHEIVVRILVIIDEDGELTQDTRYVEWKKVRIVHFGQIKC